jgi:PadR family transcriptional regulator PadR
MTTAINGLDVYRRELLKGSTETLILSLLTDQEMYGYQLAKEMERRSGGYFHLKEGTLYPALHRLERDGLIEGHWELSETGQSRRYYHVSSRGMDRLEAMLAEWSSFADAVNRIARPLSVPAYVA